MLKRKQRFDETEGLEPEELSSTPPKKFGVEHSDEEDNLPGRKPTTKYVNKQRTLVLASHGIRHRDRHLMNDLRDLLPHSKKEPKFDSKDDLFALNEVCDMNNCNNCLFFEARRTTDLYLWMSKTPHGPSAKFLVQNVHTMAELKLTGNCLKGSRPVLSFDGAFDALPQLKLLKQMFMQVFGSPRGHPKTKPFIDHVMSFYYLDGRIWVRNYQIAHDADRSSKAAEPTLVEIGPRFVLQPIKIFAGSFQGATLYQNPNYTTPTRMRINAKKATGKYKKKVKNSLKLQAKLDEIKDQTGMLDTVFD